MCFHTPAQSVFTVCLLPAKFEGLGQPKVHVDNVVEGPSNKSDKVRLQFDSIHRSVGLRTSCFLVDKKMGKCVRRAFEDGALVPLAFVETDQVQNAPNHALLIYGGCNVSSYISSFIWA